MNKIFITGVSAGLGMGMALAAIEDGIEVYGLSRRLCSVNLTRHVQCDLSDSNEIPERLEELFEGVRGLDCVVLNAGQLGPIAHLKDQEMADLEKLMQVNVWSNKIIVDWLLKRMSTLGQVVMISSGASLNGNAGWGGYSISKAALNMMVKLYASEENKVHFTSLAPGLIDTAMQDYLCGLEDLSSFPSLERLKEARGTDAMPTPERAGKLVLDSLKKLKLTPSGSYQDIRKL